MESKCEIFEKAIFNFGLDEAMRYFHSPLKRIDFAPIVIMETEEPVSNESISEDELIDKYSQATLDMWKKSDVSYKRSNWEETTIEWVKIAQQYSNTKLEELEKWITENSFNIEGQAGDKHIAIDSEEILSKIKSLKLNH